VSTTPLMQFKALLIPTLALVGFLTTTAGADVDLSQAPAFVYDATGPVPISVSQSEFSVQMVPTRGVDPAQRPTVLPQAVTPARLKPAAVDTELRIAQRGMHIVRDATLGDLRALPGAKSVLPIVYRSGSDMPMYPTEHVIVSYKTAPTDAELAELATRYQCEVERLDRGHNRVRFTIRDVAQVNPLALANLLHEDPATLYASDDFILPKVTYSLQINDPLYSLQWHLDGDVSKGAVAGSDINVETAWNPNNGPAAQGIPQVRVAIQDECVEKWHEDLLPNWATGRDYDQIPYDDDPSPDGGQRHGTSCAGVAVAKGNSLGVRGACPECGLIGVKFFGATISEQADSYLFCMDPNNDGDHSDGAAIMSNSWGYADGAFLPSDVEAAINTAALTGRNGKGCLILFAAANSDHTVNGVSALAQMPTVVCIGGTNSNGRHTEFSDVGPEVALTAPTNDRGDDGVRFPWLNITTVDNTGESGYNGLTDLNYTNQFGGTSSATPLAAGVLGLILSQDPNMTAEETLAIAAHTAVAIDPPYGRFDPTTGHSHRLGYGKVDAGAAVTATLAGLRWPGRIKNLGVSAAGNNISLIWSPPADNYADSLIVRSRTPFGWRPMDGATYTVGQEVAPGVTVIAFSALGSYLDPQADGAYFYAVYPRSNNNLYGYGAKNHVIRDAFTLFYDDSEIPDPGWETGGAGNDWARGRPTSANGIFGQVVVGSGPLSGTRGSRAINGNNCWGTDLASRYNSFADAWLQTPLISLQFADPNQEVFLEYWDWMLMETTYDQATVELVDADNQLVGTLVADTAGDYDWTKRVFDLSPYIGQTVKVRFRLISDGLFERDGWFIDEVRVSVAGQIPTAPTAESLYDETPQDTPVIIQLKGDDPNPVDVLEYVITALPQHGSLNDLGAGPIATTPYTLVSGGAWVEYVPDPGYEGPDSFTYELFDGALASNTATVKLSVGTPVRAYFFPLDVNPGWETTAGWVFGLPRGLEGDPAAAYTGLNVYGYNLSGLYESYLPPSALTSEPFNCTGLTRTTLRFARWLGVESAAYDGAAIEVTSDGTNWVTVWSHNSSDLIDTAWVIEEFNIGAAADDQPFVQVRWVMGPTDGEVEYFGWNIDDVEILGIGTAGTNQPPFARNTATAASTGNSIEITLVATDAEAQPLTFTIETLPGAGLLSDPNSGPISAVPYTLTANRVAYLPDPNFGGEDQFSFSASDGALNSNVATVSIGVVNPATFPYTLDFEGGATFDVHWENISTATGRIAVTDTYEPIGNYHVLLDSSYAGTYSSNTMTLAIDLTGHSDVLLSFDWKEFGDEFDALPDSWTGTTTGDGLSVSEDGVTWHRVMDLDGGSETYTNVLLDLDAVIANLGLSYTSTFRIRWQQYDNQPVPDDGIAIDNIGVLQGTSDPVIATSSLPASQEGYPYGPTALSVIGGDPPLTWDVLYEYSEEDLGASSFATVGVGQGWFGGNSVWSYTLPFNFPFYDGIETEATIGSDGWINFGPVVGSTYNNSELLLSFNRRIAVLWDNLRTDGAGNDVFIDESIPGQVTIRWEAITHTGSFPASFSCTLFDDGRIRLNYGPGNTNLTPTVGVSAGDQINYTLAAYDGLSTLTAAATLELQFSELPPGVMLSTDGVLSGVAQTAGRYKAVFYVEDDSGRWDSKTIPIVIVPELFGDFDLDADVDIDDFEEFIDCLEAVHPSAACLAEADGDLDGEITVADAAMFQFSFTGAP
jgi:hypothetical protein